MVERLFEIQYWIPVFVLVASVLAGIVVSKLIFSRLNHIFRKLPGAYGEAIINSLKGMPVLWGLLVGGYVGIHIVIIPSYWLHALETTAIVAGVFSVTVIAARFFSSLVNLLAQKTAGDFPATSILANIVEVSIYVIGILIMLESLGISITPILTALGVGGVAVALALKDTLENLFSGLYILLSKQVRIGDYVKLSTGEEGNVLDITWRSTTIKTLTNNLIIVPNLKIASAIITNYHLPEQPMSITVPVGVNFNSDLAFVEQVTIEVAKTVLKEVDGGIVDFDPVVRFQNFGDSRIDFVVVLRINDFAQQYLIKHEFIKRLQARYRQEGINIPFPTRTIHYDNKLE